MHNALNQLISLSEPKNGDDDGHSNDHMEDDHKDALSQMEEIEAKRRNRRYLKRENRIQRSQRSRFDGVSKMIPNKKCPEKSASTDASNANSNLKPSSVANSEKLEYLESIQSPGSKSCVTSDQVHTKIEEAESTATVEPLNCQRNVCPPRKTNLRKSESLKNIPSESQSEMRDEIRGLRRYHSFKNPSQRKTLMTSSSLKKSNKSTATASQTQKDGSGTSTPCQFEKNASATVSSSLENCEQFTVEGVFTRTGWLFRQTFTKDWSRHWFVLKDSSLTYYRDATAEHSGIMDGIFDLNQVSSIREYDSDRYFAFSLLMWDGKKHVLAAETEELRREWIQAIHYASNLWSSASKEDFIKTEIVLPEHNFHHADRNFERISSPSSLSSLPLCDDKQMEMSSSSDDQSEYFSLVDEDEDTLCSMQQDEDVEAVLELPEHMSTNDNSAPFSGDISSETDFATLSDILSAENELREKKNYVTDREVIDEFSEKEPSREESKIVDTMECHSCKNLKSKLVTAKEEIRKLKAELKEAHAIFDNLEISSYKMEQEMKLKEESYEAQIALMTAKINDLTSKFTNAERNYRQPKQKGAKSETKQERRKSSLKNKDILSLSKEYESKLSELEKKIENIETSLHKESSETDDSERLTSEVSPVKFDVHDVSESSTSSKRTNNESSKGLLSRLQTLGTKVKNCHELLIERIRSPEASDSEKPKIFVQVKDTEELSSLDDSDDWRTISLNNSVSSFPDLGKLFDELPRNLSECQSIFIRKVNHLLEWLKNSLYHICADENADNISTNENVLFIADVLNYLCHGLVENSQKSQNEKILYAIFLFFEVIKVLERIEWFKSVDFIARVDVTEWAFKTVGKTLCASFFDFEQFELEDILNLVSEIPHIRYFYPVVNKLFPEGKESEEGLSCTVDRLKQLEVERPSVLSSLQEAKDIRFKSLWDVLADVPVQDDITGNTGISNPILKYVISVTSDIYAVAELQLSRFREQTLYVLKLQHDRVQSWCVNTSEALKKSYNAFLEELKERCPMINECSFALSALGATVLKEITALVSELSFLSVTCTVLEAALTSFYNDIEARSSDCLSYEKWISELQNNFWCKAICSATDGFFEYSQCTYLNSLISGLDKNLSWKEYLQRGNCCNLKKCTFLELENEMLQNLCAKFDKGVPENEHKSNLKTVKCAQCEELQKQFTAERQTIQQTYRKEIKQLERRLQEDSQVHEQEMKEKENELVSKTTQLQRLNAEYEEQMKNLKNLYEQKLHFECDSVDEESIRKMYKTEIEDIKDMFKKGLVAIENSHNRITSEIEKRHKDEIALLEAEKQKALETEAQATMTALEAIKKSYSKQLLEETASIKEALLNKFKNEAQECESFYCKYGNELEELKREILRITDLYSEKCLENKTLEEKVNSLSHQLKKAYNQFHDLLTSSKDIDLHLAENI
ncbi:Protein outspread, partial [Stegodyphus mimosarum]